MRRHTHTDICQDSQVLQVPFMLETYYTSVQWDGDVLIPAMQSSPEKSVKQCPTRCRLLQQCSSHGPHAMIGAQ